jgi:hypothetical protein
VRWQKTALLQPDFFIGFANPDKSGQVMLFCAGAFLQWGSHGIILLSDEASLGVSTLVAN